MPVASYPAISSTEGQVHFHQLHEQCHSRIKYVKTCPLHGPVPQDEIVSGYEFEKGQFIVVEKEELTALRSVEEKTIDIQSIVDTTTIDPLYFTEHSQYLMPDGKAAQKPYHVIERCLREQNRIAIAHRVVHGKDEVLVVRPRDGVLVATSLMNPNQLREVDLLRDSLNEVPITPSEIKLTRTLFDAFYQKSVDLSQFKDEYDERVSQLISNKLKGRKIPSKTSSEPANVINLMDALKKSLRKSKPSTAAKHRTETPPVDAKRQIVAAKRKKAKRA